MNWTADQIAFLLFIAGLAFLLGYSAGRDK